MKVKKKLPLLMIFLLVIPLLVLSSLISIYMSKNSLDMHKKSLADVAHSISNYVEDFYHTEIENLIFTARIPTYERRLTFPHDVSIKNEAEQLLTLSTQTNSRLITSSLIDLSGTIISSSDNALIGTSVHDSNLFKTLIQSNKKEFNEMIVSSDQINFFSLAVKVYDRNGQEIGIINRVLDISSINNYIDQRKIDDDGYIYILDDQGKPLSFHFNPNLPAGQDELSKLSNDAELQKLLADTENKRLQPETGYFSYDYEGSPVLAYYEKVSNPEWVVVSCLTQSEIFKESTTLQLVLLLTTLTVGLISLFFGIQIAKTITNPLSYLIGKIKEIQKENFSVRCNIPGNNEFHELAVTINQMTKSLESSKQALVKTNELLKKSAYVDSLTNIANRKAIYSTLDTLFGKHAHQAVLLFDLNGFKTINDTFGSYMGDATLNAVADLLKGIANNSIHPARLSGDTFIVFISRYKTQHEVIELAEMLLKDINNITTLNEYPITLSASLGIAFLDDGQINRSELIRQANEARHAAKKNKDAQYYIYKKENDWI